MKIMNVNALFPGSTNDAFIWNNSNIQEVMQNIHHINPNQFYLLGENFTYHNSNAKLKLKNY